eukprot:gnl/Dysnectes_brevis/4933_a6865_522.p1 GENE.gnl/Dysnectes_brevis/4933_a6865_522~~gnl/Dysnectes_brevis/4933_a6865_522.p1  ORF type:complete len:693 (-),score=281.40 gnl/Dysnectes_brevis/4933_a6865_522:772-2850(-)
MSVNYSEIDGSELIAIDPYLKPFETLLKNRWADFEYRYRTINEKFGGLKKFADMSDWGIYTSTDSDGQQYLMYREWAPNAKELALLGEFCDWNVVHRGVRDPYGIWTVRIPFQHGNCPVKPCDTIKVWIKTHDGKELWRMPQRTTRTGMDDGKLKSIYEPRASYHYQHPLPPAPEVPRIYEAHVGMGTTEPRVGTYREFADVVLPSLARKGYNVVQLMAVQEHSYYASFGYQVTSFFAPASRSGSPDDLKYLVDTAHGLGITVLMDLVHSHASKNEEDGIARWDGSDHVFLPGDHPLWDSRMFDYQQWECLRLLLQNLRWWIEEYRIDGFRFDGIMSMMYWHRSAGVGYTGNYQEYFGPDAQVDVGGLTYLRLAHALIEELRPGALTIAEDVSGYPGLASPLSIGGVGFTFRFQMAVPDLWFKMLKAGLDKGFADQEVISIGKIRHALVNRRHQEKHIAYVECHDQAIVGDKTLSMWLLDSEIYTGMSIFQEASDRVKRAIRLHKLIRLTTFGLGGEGYLTFFGNEFGHPEWLDFPRPGNDWDYSMCRRQWNLEQNDTLRYGDMGRFDAAMMQLAARIPWSLGREWVLREDEEEKLLIWERHRLVFAVCFHPTDDVRDRIFGVRAPGTYRVVLWSEEQRFGGSGDYPGPMEIQAVPTTGLPASFRDSTLKGLPAYLSVKLGKQTAVVLEKMD